MEPAHRLTMAELLNRWDRNARNVASKCLPVIMFLPFHYDRKRDGWWYVSFPFTTFEFQMSIARPALYTRSV